MDGFRELYERHYPAVYKLALFLTGAPDRAEDLAADTFVRAWTARDRLRHTTVLGYLLTITRNLYRDQLRAARPFVELDEAAGDDGAARLERRSTLRDLRTRLTPIAPGDRRALLLYVVREMSYPEIAARLGVSLNAVKSRIGRARDALRAQAGPTDSADLKVGTAADLKVRTTRRT
jgi:RNA polymerase sigma-70 factor (ECF subfamily)